MNRELKKQIAELRLQQALQTAALRIVINKLNKDIPGLKLAEYIQSLCAEPILHFSPDTHPDLAQKIEDYLQSITLPLN